MKPVKPVLSAVEAYLYGSAEDSSFQEILYFKKNNNPYYFDQSYTHILGFIQFFWERFIEVL